MPAIPDQIVLKRHRDLEGRRRDIYWRRAAVGLLAAFLLAGLLNLFGQKPGDTTVTAGGVSLQLHAPSALRGGLLYEASFTVRTQRKLTTPTLVLSRGWPIANTINTLEPSPATESSHDGEISLGLGPLKAGSTYTLYGEFQVNPTSFGSYSGDISLYDGDTRLLHMDRTMVVYP
ncbi:MAG: hypothetical protein QOG85_2046 [Gaiellaceae bacterium]|nr:hypothetical protein [Gaiellaceae bacterium]